MITKRRVVFAIGAHPDDIEFMMAGTLVLLRAAGCELHSMALANGSCGTTSLSRDRIIKIRAAEARKAAHRIGAVVHPSLVDDIEIFYDKKLLARVGAVIREVAPQILLVPSPEDYMEDHSNTSRLAVTAAFCRGMRNFPTSPKRKPFAGDVAVYHALPYGLRDGMRRRVAAELFVDISTAMQDKREALSLHQSQGSWLGEYQAVDHLGIMEQMSLEVGKMSGRFRYAEGWRRHHHLGFSATEWDPLLEALGKKALIDKRFGKGLVLQRAPA